MAQLIYRYLFMRTLFGVGGLLAILTALILLVDLIESMRFNSKVTDGTFWLAVQLTFLRAPSIIQTMFPFIFLFGSIWAFHQLNKRSELAVMRSAGMSVWRLIGPAGVFSALTGFALIFFIDPIASTMLSNAERIMVDKQGTNVSLIKIFKDGIWLRQRDEYSQIIINAKSHNGETGVLNDITVWRFDADARFIERIDAREAALSGATMELYDASLSTTREAKPRRAPVYAIESALNAADLSVRQMAPETISLWDLRQFIELADSAGLPTVRYEIRLHDLWSTPLKLLAMVLIAAAFSLRPTRMGGQFRLLIMSIAAGFSLYVIAEISSAFGESGLAPVILAAWAPAIIATIGAISILLNLEEG